MEVQVFGIKKSADTRKALRFFSERRIRTHFVDLDEKAMSEGELQRFVQRFGVEALIDRTSKRYDELGLRTAQPSQSRWLARLVEEPRLLVMPLVRRLGQPPAVTVGPAEKTWLEWIK
jgi:arsenate reductase